MAKNIFMNFANEAMLHANQTAEGKSFTNVSIPCSKSATGYASFAVNDGQVLPATKKDGTVVDGYKSILMGSADKTRNVSVAVKKGRKTVYETISMTNQEIVDCVNAARKAYRASQATETAEA